MAYDKHTWVNDELITTTRLNHIEDGIAAVELTPGPKGDTGEPGPKGDTGPAGADGEKGDPGDSYTDAEVYSAIASKPEIAALSPIDDPAGADVEEVAEAYNVLLAALKA